MNNKGIEAYVNSLVAGDPMNIRDIEYSSSYDVQELDFDEEIVLDFQSLPEDNTEGAEARDFELDHLLHGDEWLDISGEDFPIG